MKYLKFLLIIGMLTSTVACKKSRYPEIENSANAQFTRTDKTITSPAAYNTFSFKKTTPAEADQFLLKVIESGNVKTVSVMVDYKKATTPTVTTYSQQFAAITTWPQTYGVALNDLVTLFAPNGITLMNLAVGDRFVFRIVITLNSGTVISEQSAVLNTAPYATLLTYTIAD